VQQLALQFCFVRFSLPLFDNERHLAGDCVYQIPLFLEERAFVKLGHSPRVKHFNNPTPRTANNNSRGLLPPALLEIMRYKGTPIHENAGECDLRMLPCGWKQLGNQAQDRVQRQPWFGGNLRDLLQTSQFLDSLSQRPP
jgi:hypothetical protein